ncbi:GNAT family N-acetyltransferase [Thalassospira lucentensis]|uniref:GNAT family N-acetyltransferase n=1 Tax=Thalassospira lucentensis TaxID=168935 RepID=UPI00142D2425|nr:hypothetical protein [Thalassospira lucentensis]NIZ03760.1 hypothetical protein [Thalassospira lucentensis]
MTYLLNPKITEPQDARIPPPWPIDDAALFAFREDQWHSQVSKRTEPSDKHHDVVLRFLSHDDLAELVDLHRKVVENLPDREIFRADRPDFIADHISRRGATVGSFVGNQLIGYAIVSFPHKDADNLSRFTELSAQSALRVAHFDGAAVHPNFRGSSLHQTMNRIRGHYALLAGYHHLMGTVSPLNPYSLGNHLRTGFRVKAHAICYGDMRRYIIHRDGIPTTNHRVVDGSDRVVKCPVDDFETVNRYLDQGLVGFDVHRTEEKNYELLMASPDSIVSDTDQVRPE